MQQPTSPLHQPTAPPVNLYSPEDMALFAQTIARLAGMLDTHLWHRAEGAPPPADAAAQAWKNCFCALVLTLNPDSRVTETLEALPPAPDQLDETTVLNAMANMGHYARAVGANAALLDGRLAPCLVIPKGDGALPYVMIAHHGAQVVIYDPLAQELRQLPEGDPRLYADAAVWLFQPFDRQRQKISRFMRAGTGQSWFRALLGRFTPTLRQIFLIGLALNIVALAPPLYMMAVYDRVISPADTGSLWPMAAGVAIALGAEYALRHIRSKALSWLSARLDTLVGTQIFAHLLGLAPNIGEKISVAAQIARIKTFESIRDLFSGSIFLSFLEIPYVVLALGLMAAIAGPLAVVPVIMALGFTLLFVASRHRTKAIIRLAAKSSSARQQFTLETFEKLEGIHANGLPVIWQRKYADLAGREIMMNFQLNWLSTVTETLAHALTLLSAVATVGYGVHLVWAGAIGTGALIASMMLVWRVITPFYSLCTMVTRLEQLRNSIQQVNDLTDVETEDETAMTSARLLDIRGEIAFSQVTMYYNTDSELVLKTADLHIRPGEIVGITGRNGTGKSTVLKLIKGMYKSQAGAVRIDGFDIRQLDPIHLRRHIGYVGQHAEFFSGTVIENMRFAKPLATESEVIQALTLADAWKDIRTLDGGLYAKLDAGRLPESLAARLSLARGYLHGGSVLLIDELPASLVQDKAGEFLRRFIDRTRGKRTLIFVSQHQDMLALADSVLEIRDGQLHYLARSGSEETQKPDADITYFTPRREQKR